jgi:hypothetical protein
MSAFHGQWRVFATLVLCACVLVIFHTASKRLAAHVESAGPDTIAAVVHEGRGMSTAQGYQYVESVDLLLKDGWAYVNLAIPPSELSVEASKSAEPEKWRRWQKQGSKILFQDKGTWTEVDGAGIVEPLPGGSRLNVRLITRKALTFGLMGGSVFTQRIQFSSDGKFSRSGDGLHGTGPMQAAGGFSASVASSESSSGRQSSARGVHNGSGGSTAVATSSQTGGRGDLSGTYSISGYTLVLHNDDGSEQRLWAFYPFAAEGKKEAIFIGDTTFNPE